MKYIWQIFNCESVQIAPGIYFLYIYVIYLIKGNTYLNSREEKKTRRVLTFMYIWEVKRMKTRPKKQTQITFKEEANFWD